MRSTSSTLFLGFAVTAAGIIAACAADGSGGGFPGGGSDSGSGGGGGSVHDGGVVGPDGTLSTGGQDGGGGGTTHDGGGGGKPPGDTGGGGGGQDVGTIPTGPFHFDGGWHPPDAGYEQATVGDGGTSTIIASGATSSSPAKFTGSQSGEAPTFVYPADGVMLPPNISGIEFDFQPGSGQTLFKLSFVTPTMTVDYYTGCNSVGGGCAFTPDATSWATLANYGRGTAPITYTLSGVDGASPGAVGVSATQNLIFSDQDLTGGIYYWNTAGVVERYDLENPQLGVEDYLDPTDVGAVFCVGCHVISREGYRIVAGKDIPVGLPNASLLDVPTKDPIDINGQPAAIAGNFFSFSPDEAHLLTSDGVSISWLEIASGHNHTDVASQGTMPDWSPDGLHMVFAEPSSNPVFASPGVDSASIASMHFNGTGWDTEATLVPFAGENNYYPAYSPDGNWVVFNRSPSNENSFSNAAPDPDAGTEPDGQLWLVSADGSGSAVQLENAGEPASWPKWAPVVHSYYDGKLMWLTFSSGRAYGLRLSDEEQTQLWMTAIDPAKVGTGDPSFPPFWLPFQDITTGNHIAQWSAAVRRETCTGSSTCPTRETCKAGICESG